MSAPTAHPSQAEEIQQQMRAVRAELRADVSHLVTSAHNMGDWASYVRAYPWLCVGAAAAAGYFLIPSRTVIVKQDAEAFAKLAKEHNLFGQNAKAVKKEGGLVAQLVSMAAAAALQGALRFASQQLTQAVANAGNPRSGPTAATNRPVGPNRPAEANRPGEAPHAR